MRHTKLMIAIVLGALLLPALASATHFVSVTGEGDCLGWYAEAQVRLRTGITEATLSYSITLSDADGNELEVQVWEGTVTGEGGATETYTFNGEWSVTAPPGMFMIDGSFHLVAPWGEGNVDEDTMEFSESFYCGTVPTEARNWGSVKGLYR